jgi:hypothetical protein
MKTLKIALVAAAAISVSAPAFAQYQPTDQYRRDMNQYQADRATYQDQREGYDQARVAYEARRDRYERDRARYDARYGYGAYARNYGPAPSWDQAYWDSASTQSAGYGAGYSDARRDYDRRLAEYDRARADYDARYGYGSYTRRYGPAPTWSGPSDDANTYGRDTSYVDPCAGSTTNGKVAGGLIGALAGAALGSNLAANGRGTEGTVLGAVVGGVVGANVGKAAAKSRCDQAGYYYNYADTMPYRENRYARSGEYDSSYYNRQRCRLAPAPVDRTGDVRYVRVCPDGSGRYRITG